MVSIFWFFWGSGYCSISTQHLFYEHCTKEFDGVKGQTQDSKVRTLKATSVLVSRFPNCDQNFTFIAK